ncbi:MAG: FAD-binding protein [Gammaproteobacteria bacterium]|nr:FAD-binding protein [Gammaproteobacteria bacterium]
MLNNEMLRALQQLVGSDNLLTDPADCWVYGYDNSRRHALPWAVVFPITHEQVVALVQLANLHAVPLVAHGRGTATTGAAVPIQGGIVVSFERMTRIIMCDPVNRLMIVEPGVSNQLVQETAKQEGFFWAPDPSSAYFSSVGGNLACNAAGPRAVKYGTCRENTLGLRVVTGQGESLDTGVYTTKGVVGYDLTRLVIGSEGTLALITQATLKLLPLPAAKRTWQVTFSSLEAATQAIVNVMQQSLIPSALEFMDEAALRLIQTYSPGLVHAQARAVLLIEMEGAAGMMEEAAAQIEQACRVPHFLEIKMASTEAERLTLWKVRKALSPLLRHFGSQKINEDVVLPISRLPEFIERVYGLAQRHQLTIVNFGHAGNGNIHVNLLFDADKVQEQEAAQECLREIFALVLSLKGTLSGEHGVGLEKLPFINQELSPVALKLMSDIKRCFDPKGILNPGKYGSFSFESKP